MSWPPATRADRPCPRRSCGIAAPEEEHHLGIPVVGRERPAMAEDDRLARAPALIEDLGAVRSEDMSISSGELVRRNAAFAATGVFAGLPFPTSDTLQVLGCVDSRVDPSDVLGLELGEGVVMRNIGGRITPATLRSWALLGRLSQGQPPGGHLVILHHTDCGITRLADYPEQLAAFFEIPADELESKAVADPYAAVRIDAAIARHALPPSRLVSGLVYDVNTGLIEIVDPATQE